MNTARLVMVGVVVLAAWRAEAKCVDVTSCFCSGALSVLVTESVDGGTAVLTSLDGGVAGQFPAQTDEVVGARWLSAAAQDRRMRIDDAGLVRCEWMPDKPVSVDVAVHASESDNTSCQGILAKNGYEQPPCGACSTSPALGGALLVLAVALRLRRRS